MVYYCKKCGRQIPVIFSGYERHDQCDVCESPLYEVPEKYIENNNSVDLLNWLDGDGKKAVEEELVKTSPEFDPYLFEHRDEILRKQNEEWDRKMAIGQARLNGMSAKEALDTNGQGYKNKPIITCPYCNSTNCTKISGLNRAVSIGFWGLMSKKIGKQWHCDECGSDF